MYRFEDCNNSEQLCDNYPDCESIGSVRESNTEGKTMEIVYRREKYANCVSKWQQYELYIDVTIMRIVFGCEVSTNLISMW